MITELYKYRFQIFLITLISILFSSLVFPEEIYENYISHLTFLANLLAGILLISERKNLMFFLIFLMVVASFDFGSSLIDYGNVQSLKFTRMTVYFLFYICVTIEIIYQIWNAKKVNETVIFGVISGYISLGLIGFFICLTLETMYPGSFQGLHITGENDVQLTESVMYYSYITLLTIGYGDVLPVTQIAQKASILIGLMGQFYMVIITAIVVGKYISRQNVK